MHNEAKEQTPGIEPDNQKAVPTGSQVSPKNKWRSHIGGTGWDRHKKRG